MTSTTTGFGPAAEDASGRPLFDADAAKQHLALIGHSLQTAALQAIHWSGKPAQTLGPGLTDWGELATLSASGSRLYVRAAGAHRNTAATTLPAVWCEWDGIPPEAAEARLREAVQVGLPAPTCTLTTWPGGSLHVWWRLLAPDTDLALAEQVMKGLTAVLGSDPAVARKVQPMRLAGSLYWQKAGQPNEGACLGVATLQEQHPEQVTTLAALLAWLEPRIPAPVPKPIRPAPASPAAAGPRPADLEIPSNNVNGKEPPPRPYEELERIVNSYPTIRRGSKQRGEALKFVCGLTRAMEEIGGSRAHAIALASNYHPEASDTFEQVEGWPFSEHSVESFIAQCKAAGVDVTRHDLKGHRQEPPSLATGNGKADPRAGAPSWGGQEADDAGGDLPPYVTPERLAQIAAALAVLEQRRSAHLAAIPSLEALEEEIIGCGLSWPADTGKTLELADLIGHAAAVRGCDRTQLIAFRDRLVQAIGSGPKKDLLKRIEAAAATFDTDGGTKAERDQLIAERDARALAIAARQQHQALVAAAEARKRKLVSVTGADAILQAIGDGWVEQEKGPPTRSLLHRGLLFDTLLRDMPGRLRFSLRGLVPTIDGDVPPPRDLQDLHVRLNSQGWTISKEHALDSVVAAANRDAFDPFRDFLDHVAEAVSPAPEEVWGALDKHLLGIDDPIAQRFLPQYLISAVARTYLPGCGVRRTPVLTGPEGRGKTTLAEILFTPQLYVSNLTDMGKDDQLRCHSAACVELSELDGITRRADQEHLKAFLTEKRDTFRPPYGSATAPYPRRFVFWGTSNGAALRALSGNTRFVCIEVPDRFLPLDWARQHRDALWARAVLEFKACNPVLGVNEPWDRWSEADRNAFADRNAAHQQSDPWQEKVQAFLDYRQQVQGVPVTIPEVLDHLAVPVAQQRAPESARVQSIAEAHGWRHRRRRPSPGGNPRRGLWPPVPGGEGEGAGAGAASPCPHAPPVHPSGGYGGSGAGAAPAQGSSLYVPPVPPQY